jgi:hypothetical protein
VLVMLQQAQMLLAAALMLLQALGMLQLLLLVQQQAVPTARAGRGWSMPEKLVQLQGQQQQRQQQLAT